jgi:hypothetical protein
VETEFATALALHLTAELAPLKPLERSAVYARGGPVNGQVTYAISYGTTGVVKSRVISVTVDVDIWHQGPDSSQAEDLASLVEQSLIGWSVKTVRQGSVRISGFSRAYINDLEPKLSHITMRFDGRAFRRLEQ